MFLKTSHPYTPLPTTINGFTYTVIVFLCGLCAWVFLSTVGIDVDSFAELFIGVGFGAFWGAAIVCWIHTVTRRIKMKMPITGKPQSLVAMWPETKWFFVSFAGAVVWMLFSTFVARLL